MADDDTVLGHGPTFDEPDSAPGHPEPITSRMEEAGAFTLLAPGNLLHNTYEIQGLIGRGGFGEVYKARHVELKTWHAIKLIKPELVSDPRALDLVRREATVLKSIRNDAIIDYDVLLRDERGRVYLVMEYADGPSLRDMIRQRPLSLDEIPVLRDRLLHGLAVAHGKGVFHRDLSPDNVILPEGRVENAKLIDFGIAKLTRADAQTVVATGVFMGKVQYAAPEQFGLFGGAIGSYTDIYSLALVLAAALGEPLDMGHDLLSAYMARQKVPNMDRLPAALREQFTAMLQPDPARRPQNAEAILRRWPDMAPRTRGDSWLDWLKTGTDWLKWAAAVVAGAALLAVGLRVIVPREEPKESNGTTIDGKSRESLTIQEIAGLPPEAIYSHAQKFYAEGYLDDGFLLLLTAAEKGHGPAALELAKQYDPVLWGQLATSLTTPNARQARKWYQRASSLGIAEARTRLTELAAWEHRALDSDE